MLFRSFQRFVALFVGLQRGCVKDEHTLPMHNDVCSTKVASNVTVSSLYRDEMLAVGMQHELQLIVAESRMLSK